MGFSKIAEKLIKDNLGMHGDALLKIAQQHALKNDFLSSHSEELFMHVYFADRYNLFRN